MWHLVANENIEIETLDVAQCKFVEFNFLEVQTE